MHFTIQRKKRLVGRGHLSAYGSVHGLFFTHYYDDMNRLLACTLFLERSVSSHARARHRTSLCPVRKRGGRVRSAYRKAPGEVWKHGDVGDLIGDEVSIRNRHGRDFSLTFSVHQVPRD